MIKKQLVASVILLFSILCFAQNQEDFSQKINEAKKLIQTDSKKAIENLIELKKLAKSKNDEKSAYNVSYQLALIYMNVTADFDKTIKETYEMEAYAKSLNDHFVMADILQMRGISYISLNLLDKGFAVLQNSINELDQLKPSDNIYFKKSIVLNNISDYYRRIGNAKEELNYKLKSFKIANKINDSNKSYIKDKKLLQAFINLQIGLLQEDKKNYDSAKYYYFASEDLFNNYGNEFTLYGKVETLKSLSSVFNKTKDFEKSIAYANKALKHHNSQSQPNIIRDLYSLLYKSYVEVNKNDSAKKYMNLYTQMNDSIELANFKKQNQATQSLVDENEINANKKRYLQVGISILIFLIVLSFILYYYWKNNKRQKEQYRILLDKLELSTKEKTLERKIKSVVDKNKINNETLETLINGLENFEINQEYTNQSVSLTQLANDLNTNTKYLSQIIHEYKGKNFNNYINSLRIQYIVEELYHNPITRKYKIATLAEMAGFSSREVFTSVFKKETGVNPSFFLRKLNEE